MDLKGVFLLDISSNLEKFLERLTVISSIDGNGQNQLSVLRELAVKQIWTNSDKEQVLQNLTQLFVVAELSSSFKAFLSNIIPELLFRFLEVSTSKSEENPLLVLKVLQLHISKRRSILELISSYIKQLTSKVVKFEKNEEFIILYFKLIFQICKKSNTPPETFCSPQFLSKFQGAANYQIKLYISKLFALSMNVADYDSYCPSNDIKLNTVAEQLIDPLTESEMFACHNKSLNQSNFKGNFIPVFNMLFKVQGDIQDQQQYALKHKLVLTDTTIKNLKSLVLGFSTNSTVLVSGDIGCGKTSLIEYFAQCLGRVSPPLMLKLQLGDQVESKSLLGTYVCSDTPGEFVWQPGTLTKAMQLGSWVLLEDVDQAPTDVISMLMALAKTKTLLIPGHSKEIKAAEGFQLFVTRRNASWRNENTILGLFVKQCHQVYMEYPKKNELVEILKQKFVNLSPIANKIVDIFCLVSGNKNLETESDVQLAPVTRRKNTPRDLFKLCERLDGICNLSNNTSRNVNSNENMFHHAVQCFHSSYEGTVGCDTVAYAIGAKLGLSKEKVGYYLFKYKPDIKLQEDSFTIGHTTLVKNNKNDSFNSTPRYFAYTRHSLCLLEKLSVCISNSEPVLLVGDTGCGKTSAVQYLAEQCNSKLDVINMSQQTDSADLFGGFKPIDIREKVKPVKDRFVMLFKDTYNQKENAKFLAHVSKCFVHKRWSILMKLIQHCCVKACKRDRPVTEDALVYDELKRRWDEMAEDIKTLDEKVIPQDGLVFSFIEGVLVRSLKMGNWILLDEINLATPESLEYLSGLLDFKSGSVVLSEKGDIQEVKRHENFRIFACMNPATDVGKKDLPHGIRNRFTELYVEEMEDEVDLTTLVSYYLKNTTLNSGVIDGIIKFYLTIRQQAKEKLVDGSGHRPLYSLRTLCRGLQYAVKQVNMSRVKSIYEGISMSFLTQLDKASKQAVEKLIYKHILEPVKNVKAQLKNNHHKPKGAVNVEGYWIDTGSSKPSNDESYVMTSSVKANLTNLARVVAGGYPVLLQGETSVGKTSLIIFLAKITGNKCVRVNNHEHTDIQEYIGCYGPDDSGNLVFKEGVLVTAMRYGHWMILDELNLAPSDVLEALNRVLDDNRELFIPETQEVVKAHPKFILFATQNPPGHYGGRKVLSRAFRNRYVELHLDQIPSNELEQILHQRCQLPRSYCKKFVKVMLDLQVRRRNSGIFEGKHGFMTLRDLFRWAERYHMSSSGQQGFYDWEQCMCEDGFMLIAGRCRRDEETKVIKHVLELNFKRTIDLDQLYNGDGLASRSVLQKVMSIISEEFKHIVWTFTMKRLAVLVGRALQFNEAVLLVGETGCGKTTICQLFAAVRDSTLYTVNCHMHTEAADFLGGLRPVRTKDESDITNRLFEWKDGPLIKSMEEGQVFLIDEISLADDSVLERMNSVLEPERTLVLSEKGDTANLSGNVEIVKASKSFCLLATMNPGGDYGKKELSPALRNRFTDIWCCPSESSDDLKRIIEHNITPGLKLKKRNENESGIGSLIIQFLNWFKGTEVGSRLTISIRDLLSWVMFINTTINNNSNNITKDVDMRVDYKQANQRSVKPITLEEAYVHGACLVFIDAIGSGNTAFGRNKLAEVVKRECISFLSTQVDLGEFVITDNVYTNTEAKFGIHPFLISKGTTEYSESGEAYNFDCKTTRKNVIHVLRGLQLHRPILLEGSPGVGKTSLVIALARMAGHPITRINLSEETDISDLFGADLPGEGVDTGRFLWRDGPFLRALKSGHWVVFDELNLASQSVLEGLNACFDHRAEIFIPELNKTFSVEKNTRIFACQNPLHEGGGRKGLPKSFLNRFTKVYIDALTADDLCKIIQSIFPEQDTYIITKMVSYNDKVNYDILSGDWGRKGGPWQFNIRDMTRWCKLVQKHQDYNVGDFIRLLYQARMRSLTDRRQIVMTYERVFMDEDVTLRQKTQRCTFKVTPSYIKVGYSTLPRCKLSMGDNSECQLLRSQLSYLESIMKCVEMSWMALLVGSESCGKNTLVKMLSTLTGHELLTMCCNSSTDSTDLIGSFEQVNKTSELLEICKELKTLVNKHIPSLINQDGFLNSNAQSLLNVRGKLEMFLLDKATQSNENVMQLTSAIQSTLEYFRTLQKQIIEEADLVRLDMLLERFLNKTGQQACHFEWVDGILVNALKKGHWLLLKNANLCSASILDRLNGLLEPGGVLCLDERGVINGDIVTVKPHPDFRLFLSVDPKFGEISRAMRNRGVEIYLLSEEDGIAPDQLDMNLLIKNQDVFGDVADVIRVFHQSFKYKYESHVSWPVLLQCCKITARLVENNYDTMSAIRNAVIDTYAPYLKEVEEDVTVLLTDLLKDALTTLDQSVRVSGVTALIPSVKEWSQFSPLCWQQRNLIPINYLSADDDIDNILASILYIEHTALVKLSSDLQHLYACLKSSEQSSTIQKFLDYAVQMNIMGQAQDNTLVEVLNRTIFEKEEQDQAHRFVLLLLLFLRGIQPDTMTLPPKKGSLMFLSQQFNDRKLKLSGLPHVSVSYLYTMMNRLFVQLFRNWIAIMSFTNVDEFAKILNAFEWLIYFSDHVTSPLPISIGGDVGFSLSQFALHWKWFNERFFQLIDENLPLETCETMVTEVNNTLGEDQRHFQYYKALSLFCKPMTMKSSLQSQLLTELGVLFETAHSRENRVMLKEAILKVLAKVMLGNDITSCQGIVNQAKIDVKKAVTVTIEQVLDDFLQLIYKCFQNSFIYEVLRNSSEDQLQKIVTKNSVDKMFSIFVEHLRDIDPTSNLFIVKQCVSKNYQQVSKILPHLKNAFLSNNYPDVSTLLGVPSEEKKMEGVRMPLYVPLFLMLCKIRKLGSTKNSLQIPLKEMESSLDKLQQLLSFMWEGECDLFANLDFFDNMAQDTYKTLVSLLQVLLTALDRHDLISHQNTKLTDASDVYDTTSEATKHLCGLLKKTREEVDLPKYLAHIFVEIEESLLKCCRNKCEKWAKISVFQCYASLAQLQLVTPYLKYDPVEEMTCRKTHLQQQLSLIHKELQFRYKVENIWSGTSELEFSANGERIHVDHFTSNAFIVQVLLRRRQFLIDEIKNIHQQEVVRPVDSQYDIIWQDFNYFNETIGNVKTVMSLVKSAEYQITCRNTDPFNKDKKLVIHKMRAWIHSTNQFVGKLSHYTFYQDVITPPILAIKSCQKGMLALIDVLQEIIQHAQTIHIELTQKSTECTKHAKVLLQKLSAVVYKKPLSSWLDITNQSTIHCFTCLSRRYPDELSDGFPAMLTIGLFSIRRYLSVNRNFLEGFHFQKHFCMSWTLERFYRLWCNKKEYDKQEEIKKVSMFKYKTKLHCETISPGEELESMEKSLFPTFDHAFEVDDPLPDIVASTEDWRESPQQSTSVSGFDERVVYAVIKSIYLNAHPAMCWDVNDVINKSFEFMSRLMTVHDISGDSQVFPKDESGFPISFLMLCRMIDSFSQKTSIQSEIFNIYEDSDIQETMEAKTILTRLQLSVVGLLNQFEDQPALLQILKLTDRILSFGVSIPLMKMVTGFELLLKYAQDWETYAASHVSLKIHLEEVVGKVIHWRRLELKTWSSLLQKTEKKHEEGTAKWFFHFVNLLHEIIGDKNADEGEYVSALKELLENANVGDFNARLELVQTLLVYIKEFQNFDRKLEYVTMNIIRYYQQFQSIIEQHKENGKKPIHKELMDYIKIAKWNDSNYYSIKLTAEKSHRKLTKFVYNFQAHLSHPITQFLQNTKTITKQVSTVTKNFQYTTSARGDGTIYLIEGLPKLYLSKTDTVSRKMKCYIDKIIKEKRYGEFVESLDLFAGDIIDGMNRIRNHNFDNIPKEKQKEARNNIQQLKRKKLASLMKLLRELGLSSHKADVLKSEADILRLPIPAAASTKYLSSEVNEMIEACNYYYFQSIARHVGFQDAMCSPSKDIGPNAISHFKGQTSHLLHITCEQRPCLDTLLSSHLKIKTFLNGLEKIRSSYDINKSVPSEKSTKDWLNETQEILTEAFNTLNYVKEILIYAPSYKNIPANYMDTSSTPNNKDESHSEDETLRSIVADLEATIERIKNVCNSPILQEFGEWEDPIYDWSYWQYVEERMKEVKNILQISDEVIEFCSSRRNNLLCPEKSPVMEPLIEMKANVEDSLKRFDEFEIDADRFLCGGMRKKGNIDLRVAGFEKLVKKVMLSVQNIVNVKDAFSLVELKSETEEALMKGQICPLLTTTFISHLSMLDIQAISSLCTTNTRTELTHYLNLIPVLQEYVELSSFYVFHTVMMHRSTCKLLSILYQLFTTLLKEGFCKLPDESDCTTEEGATEFEDIDDGGLGEGTGAKDVSDQIEGEDQVEDTNHETQENENKTNDEEEDKSIQHEKEGIEMTDDFEANLEDMELSDNEDDSKEDEKDETEEEEIDKQMGDVDDEQQLDKNMWDEEEQGNQDEGNQNEKDDGRETKDDEQGQAKEWKSEQGWSAKDEELEGQEGEEDKSEEPQPDDDLQPPMEELDENEAKGDDDEEAEQTNENDDQMNNDLEMGEMSDGDEGTMEKKENQDDAEDESNQESEATMEIPSNEVEEGEDETKEENTLQNSLQENVPTEGIEATKATGGGHQNSSTQDPQKENAGSEELSEQVNDSNQEGQYGRVLDTKISLEKQKGKKRKDFQKSNSQKTLENQDYPKEAKKRRALEADAEEKQDYEPNDGSDTYQHINNNENNSSYDDVSVDVISKEQQKEMENIPAVNLDKEKMTDVEDSEGGEMDVEQDHSMVVNPQGQMETCDDEVMDEQNQDVPNEDMQTNDDTTGQPHDETEPIKSDFFTNSQQLILQNYNLKDRDDYIHSLRKELEDRLTEIPSVSSRKDDSRGFDYVGMWMKYDQLTSNLSMQLCEQLRLVIEPTQASKLKGDYRTGKRLNMRKIIPYIASQFQKDKIWLRRTKKSKRNYQIALAVDDSSSMMDNHLKQLAFESIVVISNGLKLLEAGDLAVISFGEDSQLVHSFQENFNEETGASIFQQFTFEQKKTRVAHLLKYCTLLFDRNRRVYDGIAAISQLLLIVSDGRGIYVEGKESVTKAVTQAREMGIFIVFIILDDPKCQNSIMDIKVPVFKPGGGMPEIKSYIEEFPFPFYLLLRDINSLPYVLSDALKQWFELVTQPI